MTAARREPVPIDLLTAGAHLQRAREFLADAHAVDHLSTRQVLAYQACVAGMEAAVAAGGLRISPGSGYHHELLTAVQELLEPDRADLIESIDDARAQRADVSYYAGFVSKEEASFVAQAAEDLLDEVDAFISAQQ